MCNCDYYDRAVHVSVAVDMRTLLDRKNFSSRTTGQVATRRVTGLIIKRLWVIRRILFIQYDTLGLILTLYQCIMRCSAVVIPAQSGSAAYDLVAILDPASRAAQKYTPLLMVRPDLDLSRLTVVEPGMDYDDAVSENDNAVFDISFNNLKK